MSTIAAQSFLLVAPAAANRQFFANFKVIVNDYLERPPFNFVNVPKRLNITKRVSVAVSFTS